MTFEEKVRSLTAKELILLMLDAIENPVVKLDFTTFGSAYENEEDPNELVCYGCAATNLIYKLSGVKFTADNIIGISNKAEAIECNPKFIDSFEEVINALRLGAIYIYNTYAEEIGIAKINSAGIFLPEITDGFTQSDLEPYRKLAEMQQN